MRAISTAARHPASCRGSRAASCWPSRTMPRRWRGCWRRMTDIAAAIIEPTGAHGARLPIDPAFLVALRELTRQHGVVLIFDEVVTGFRVSPGGAPGEYGIRPDLTTLAKILAGGLPGGG